MAKYIEKILHCDYFELSDEDESIIKTVIMEELKKANKRINVRLMKKGVDHRVDVQDFFYSIKE